MISHRVSALWIAPCVAAAIPLAIAPGFLYFYDVTPKVVLLFVGAALTLPFVDPRKLLSTAPGKWFCWLLTAAFLSLLISSVFSVRTDLSIFGTNWRRFGLISQSALFLFTFVVAADLTGGVERLKIYLRASTVAAILAALYGILQYLGWDPWLDPKTYHIGTGEWTIVRPPGTLGYATYLANYLTFGAFQGLAAYRLETKILWRRTGLAATVLSTIAIVLSGTRAAWLGLIVGGLVLWWREGRRPSARMAWTVVGIAALAVVFYLSPAGLQLRSRMRWAREDPAGGARLYLWRDSLGMVGRHWLVGSGPETFSVEFPQFQSRELSRTFPEFYHESAHNIFLDAATAQGLPGLLIILAAAVMGFRGKRSAVLLAGFSAILVCHQFSVFTIPTALAFWITLAMLVTADVSEAGETARPTNTNTVLPNGGAGGFACDRRMVRLLPVSLALSVALLMAAARLTIGDRHLAQMREAVDASRFDVAKAEFQAAGQRGLHADLWYSRKLLSASQLSRSLTGNIARTQEALAAGISASGTAEDPYNAWMNLGLVYAKLNNVARTEYCIRQAITSSPNCYKPHLALAQLLLATNRPVEGQNELEIAKNLNPALNSTR